MLVPSIYSFFYITTALLSGCNTQKPTPPTVFNLQASDWVHCEEETGAYCQLSRFTYKLVGFFLQIFKVFYFFPKNTPFSKNSLKFIIHIFFQKEMGIRI